MSGDLEAGEGEAGEAIPSPVAGAKLVAPSALQLDPVTRRHVLNADGTFASLHPVDAQVVNALLIARGKLRSSPETGNGIWELQSPHEARAKAFVEDQVRLALRDLTSAGDITILAIVFETSGQYATLVGVDYYNNRLPKPLRFQQSPRLQMAA
jgi:hypothetical protein